MTPWVSASSWLKQLCWVPSLVQNVPSTPSSALSAVTSGARPEPVVSIKLFIVTVGLNLIQMAEEQLPTLQHLLACWSTGSTGDWWSWLPSLFFPKFGFRKEIPPGFAAKSPEKMLSFPTFIPVLASLKHAETSQAPI